nr:tetratricopeptide repeat-containing glycosyltransferase family protein [Azospirillum sp. A1-3]
MAEAIAECRASLRTAPRTADALNLLGAALFSAGDDGAAVEPLREAVRLQPGHASALTNLAVVLQHRQEWAAAERSLRTLLVLSPELAFAHSRLGSILKETGDLAQAVRHLSRMIRLAPPSAQDWLNLGLVRLLNGDFAEAEDAFRRTIAHTPEGAYAHAQLGEIWLRLGRLKPAAVAFARALCLDPTLRGANDGLARCRHYATAAMARAEPTEPASAASGGFVMRGAFTSHTGYGHFCRRLIQRLRRDAVPLQAIGILGPDSWPEESLDRPVPARAVVNCLIPLATERVPGLATVTFSMFEGTCIPSAWRRQSALSDLVLVPTESSRLAWEAGGFPAERLRICPLGVDPEDAVREDAPAPTLVDPNGQLVSRYRHRFLNISDFIPRKNILALLRVWLRATAPTDDAVLILKLGKGGGDTAMRAELGALLRLAEEGAGKRLAQAAPINLIDRSMSDIAMTGLYRAATHYWSLSHGEGWDLPMCKAGAMGLTLVAPRHSAYVDYLDDTTAHMIPATVGPALLPGGGYYPPFHGLDWWNPDEDAATDILRDIIQGDSAPKSARARLLERFTWERSAARLLAILDEAGLRG